MDGFTEAFQIISQGSIIGVLAWMVFEQKKLNTYLLELIKDILDEKSQEFKEEQITLREFQRSTGRTE